MFIIFIMQLPISAQIKNINFDLSNEYINRVYSDSTIPYRDIYRQYYLFKTDGHLIHPNLLTFNIKSDLYIISDSQIANSLEKTQNLRNFGYYDFNIMLLPALDTNIKIFSLQKKTDRNEEVWNKTEELEVDKLYSETTINRTGLTIRRSPRENLPGIIFTGSRLSSKGGSKTAWLKDVLDIKLFNNNLRDKASYSLSFRGYNQENNIGSINDVKYDLNLLTDAQLSDRSKITMRGNYIKYSLTESAIGDLRHYFKSSKMLHNDFSIRVNQYKYSSGENLSLRVQNRLRLDGHKNYKFRLTKNYNNRITKRSTSNTYDQSGYIKPELIFNKRNRYLHWNGFVHYNLGIVDNDAGMDFTHNANGNFRLSTLNFKFIRVSLSEGIGYSKFLNNIQMLRYKSGLEILLDLKQRFNAGGYLTWDKSTYLSQSDIEYSRLLFKGIINSQLTNNIRIKFEHQHSFNYSSYTNDIIRSRLTISESGIIKNAVFHVIAERILMGDDNYHRDNLNASVSYRIFKFIITGSYGVNYSNNLRFDEVKVMIRRPIGFQF